VSNAKQHIIPEGYLKAWSAPNAPKSSIGSVWVVQKANPSEKALEPPTNYFCGPETYTIKAGGGRNLAIENALAMIEGDFGRVRKRLQATKPLDAKDRTILAHFCGAMLSRTGTLASTLREINQRSRNQATRLEEKEDIEPSLRLSTAIDEFLPDIEGEAVGAGLHVIPGMLFRMHLSIFVTEDEAGFVTGDNPALICTGDQRPFLGHQDAECTVPLSPNHMAFYSWKVKPMLYPTWRRAHVDQINSRTIACCDKEFVSWKGIVRPECLKVY
jgi:Protein of unknown function (DUF4238)